PPQPTGPAVPGLRRCRARPSGRAGPAPVRARRRARVRPPLVLLGAHQRLTAFEKLSEEERLRGWRFTVARARFRAPDGEEFERDIVHHPGAVAVVPLHDDGTVTLVRQYRASLERDLVEIP